MPTNANPKAFLDARTLELPILQLSDRLGCSSCVHPPISGLDAERAIQHSQGCIGCHDDNCGSPLSIRGTAVVGGCPLGNRIRDWQAVLALLDAKLVSQFVEGLNSGRISAGPISTMGEFQYVAQGFFDAFQILTETNPMPEWFVACPAFCKHGCVNRKVQNREGRFDPIDCQLTEHTISYVARKMGWVQLRPLLPMTKFKVSVIGAGPAGLALAQRLAEAGINVVVYDAQVEPGGLLRYGIPEHHLEKSLLDWRINLMRNGLPVTFITSTKVGRDISLTEIYRKSDWVVIAVGASKPKRHPQLPSGSVSNAFQAMDYLVNPASIDVLDKNIIAVGGGFTVLDVLSLLAREIHQKRGGEVPEIVTTLVRKREATDDYQASWEQRDYLLGIAEHDEMPGGQGPWYQSEIVKFHIEGDRITGATIKRKGKEQEIKIDIFFQALGFMGIEDDFLNALRSFKYGNPIMSALRTTRNLGYEMISTGLSLLGANSWAEQLRLRQSPVAIQGQEGANLIRPVNGWFDTSMPCVSVIGDAATGASTIVNAVSLAMVAARRILMTLTGQEFWLLPKPEHWPGNP